MIKNIIFDLSEVIISGYHGIEKIMEKNYGIKAHEFDEQKTTSLDMFLELMRGKYTEDEYTKKLLENTNWNISIEEMKKAFRENLNIPVIGTMDIIKRLKGKYRLILLSDHVKEWLEYILENNKELDIFDEKIFSHKLGKLKSDEGTFKLILEKLNINANETIFIDDYKENIAMANEQGINTILFKNSKQLEKELKEKYKVID